MKSFKKYLNENCCCVADLEKGLKKLDNHDYDSINQLMLSISKKNNKTGKELHNDFVAKHGKSPDTWIKQQLEEVKKPTGDLKKACWKGYTAVGTKEKNGKTVPNCVPEEVKLDEASKDNPRHPMHQSDPSLYKKTTKGMAKHYATHTGKYFSNTDTKDFTLDYKTTNKEAPRYKNEEIQHLFDIIEEMVEDAAAEFNIDVELLWERLESVSDEELIEESAAWQRKAGKDPKGGLNRKGVASYRRENPGSKLKMAVTTPPSKLKPGSKAANRRKSFCARMGGMEGPMKKPNGEPTRKALALRKWNC